MERYDLGHRLMLKLGVFHAEDYVPAAPRIRSRPSLFGRRISLQLLRTSIPASPQEIAVFEAAMIQMRLTSGIYRTTFRQRFHDLDPLVNEIVADRFPRDGALEVHDWAASDCLTSSEWARSLFQVFPNAILIASDLTLFLVEVTLPDGAAFVLEPDGGALQYIRKPFVIRLSPPEPKMLLVNHLLWKRAEARLKQLREILTVPQAWLDSDDDVRSVPPFVLRRIPMTHPDAREFALLETRFSIRRHSAFDPLDRPVDVVRTMNIFNPVYFGGARILDGARAVWQSLKAGGHWVVGRTVEDTRTHHASVLEKTGAGFSVLSRVGGGSEIESLVLNLGL